MIQMDLEQRQSARFLRPFWVTGNEDEEFCAPFEGFDVNLTGLSFWVDEADLFLPEQQLSLRIKNIETGETYCLESVEVVHLRAEEGRFLCGCHIVQVTSAQLLSHHRTVMTDEKTALVSMASSKLSEFDFVEDSSSLSTDQADFQEASMALNLAISQLKSSRSWGRVLIKEMQDMVRLSEVEKLDAAQLQQVLNQFSEYYEHMSDTTIALGMLAKLLAHTPNTPQDKQSWKTLISDFERRFLTEQQQIAYDFMHQGMSADDALKMAEEYVNRL